THWRADFPPQSPPYRAASHRREPTALGGTAMVSRILIGVFFAAMVAACDSVPTAPTPLPASPRPSGPAPAPIPFFEPFTELKLGETVTRHVPGGSPECYKVPGFECEYYRFTAAASGVIDITLTYSFVVQPVDMSVNVLTGQAWWAN